MIAYGEWQQIVPPAKAEGGGGEVPPPPPSSPPPSKCYHPPPPSGPPPSTCYHEAQPLLGCSEEECGTGPEILIEEEGSPERPIIIDDEPEGGER